MNKTRSLLFLFTIFIILVAMVPYVFFGINFFIDQWNIAIDPPGFYDSRQLAWAAESYYRGYDPMVENPANPRGLQINYPRIWYLLFPLIIDESRTNILGTIIVLIFFTGVGIFWFSHKFDNLTYYMLSIIILSPAVMLGIERANNDLIIFFILALALTICNYAKITGFVLFIIASVLKIFPVFGFSYLLKEEKRNFFKFFLIASGVFILYALLSLNDFSQIFKITSKGVSSSYGLNVWWWSIKHHRYFNHPISGTQALIFQISSYVAAVIIVAATLLFGMRPRDNGLHNPGKYIDSFRVGATIYSTTFLIMNTNDYRLLFLIFTIPQLVAWARDKHNDLSFISRIILPLMVFSLWSNFVMRFLGRKITFVMEEFTNWLMLAGLLYLLFSSLPNWFKDYIRRPFSFMKSSGSEPI